MHARAVVMLAALALFAEGAMAQRNALSATLVPHGGFIDTGVAVTTGLLPPAERQPCTDSTFSEFGHGHADVARAGYASMECPHYDADMASSAAGNRLSARTLTGLIGEP